MRMTVDDIFEGFVDEVKGDIDTGSSAELVKEPSVLWGQVIDRIERHAQKAISRVGLYRRVE